jgi:DNA mismatch repair protein MutH
MERSLAGVRDGAGDAGASTSELHTIRLSERTDHALGRPIRYRAECDCGWVGDWHATAVGARAGGRQHQALAQRGWDDV